MLAVGKVALGLGLLAYAFMRGKKDAPSEGGGFVETRDGTVRVRTTLVVWTLASLSTKFVNPREAGPQFPGALIAPLSPGGMNAQAWAQYQQSQGLHVAISLTDEAAGGELVAFPRAQLKSWCAPGKGYALLLQAVAPK